MVKVTNDKGLEMALDVVSGTVIVCFYQIDSTACENFKAEFEALAKSPGLARKATFLKIDALENPGITEILAVRAVPTTLIMKGGERIGCFEGPYSRESLEGRILDLIGTKKKRDA